MRLSTAAGLIVAATAWLSGCGGAGAGGTDAALKEAWTRNNDPSRLRGDYVVTMAALPLAGTSVVKPWPDYYWANFKAGISFRWNDPASPPHFTYPLASQADVAALDEATLRTLSPAEKFDLYVSDYAYPLVKHQRRNNSPTDQTWFGLCHGWAPASLHFSEPKPVTLANADGVQIPFGSSDVKALLIMAQQYKREAGSAKLLGARCNVDLSTSPDLARHPECRDVNAGSFHIIVANQLGLRHEGFVADMDRGHEVWNQPVFDYTSEVVSETADVYAGAAPGTARIMRMRTVVAYPVSVSPHWEAKGFPDDAPFVTKKPFVYDLELGADGAIIGGEWRQEDRPDFLWMQSKVTFAGFFAPLEQLYAASTGG